MPDTQMRKKHENTQEAGGHFFLSNSNSFAPNNGAILTMSTIIKAVMSSGAEAELGALFLNEKEVVFNQTNTHQNGPPSTTHSHPNRQHDGGGGRK